MSEYVHYYVNHCGHLDPEMAAALAALDITAGAQSLSVCVEASDELSEATGEVAVTEEMAREARKARRSLERLWEMIRPRIPHEHPAGR